MIAFGTSANGGHADAVGVAERNLGTEGGLAVLHLDPCHSVGSPDLAKGLAFGKHCRQPVAIAGHRLWADGMQRHQHVITSFAKGADPVLRSASSGIAHQPRPFGSSGSERTE